MADLAELLERAEGKPCEHCSAWITRPGKLSRAQWARRRFCSRSCIAKSVNAAHVAPIGERLLAQAEPDPVTGCINWTAHIDDDGYGRITVGNQSRRAHVVSYEACNGPAKGLHVLHRCDNRRCINPAHLFLGTNTDNTADRNAKGRQARGEGHARAKLTADDVRAIRSSTEPHTVLAERYGVGPTAIFNIRNRRSWAHVAD